MTRCRLLVWGMFEALSLECSKVLEFGARRTGIAVETDFADGIADGSILAGESHLGHDAALAAGMVEAVEDGEVDGEVPQSDDCMGMGARRVGTVNRECG